MALQRRAGNQAVVALLARRQAVPKPSPAAAGKLMRDGPYEGENAGCGICSDPATAGRDAHVMVQSKMGHLGVDNELRVAAGAGKWGQLDLGRWDDKVVEIGEIKPGHDEGMARGEADLKHYEGMLKKTNDPKFKDKDVRRLAEAAPAPQIFLNEGVALPEPQMLKVKLNAGVYGYWCEPSKSLFFEAARGTKKGSKGVTKAALEAKAAFFDSDCVRKHTKERPVQDKRVRIKDRAGATRLATVPLAIAILQSRAFHLKRELDLLSGEHKLAHEHWRNTLIKGAVFGGPLFAGEALAALWTGMPSVEIWASADGAATKATGAADLEPLAKALAEFEEAMITPRGEFLRWKARRDGTPAPQEPHTPAPASGAGTPQQGAAPPLPPPAQPAQQGQQGHGGADAGAKTEGGGLTGYEIAALAALVIVTFLILQPEIGGAAVVGAVGAEGAAGAIGVEAGAGVLLDAAAVTGEAALELAAEAVVSEPLVGAAMAL